MTISFTVREVTTESLVVDYGDGSWAQVPLRGSEKKSDILKKIASFNPGLSAFASVSEVPFEVGESGEVQTAAEEAAARVTENNSRPVTYAELRANAYPALGDQLDALYWARQGDDTAQQAIDEAISAVKAAYPKDMEPIARAEYNAVIDAAGQ